ncbi:MAG: hypothetical protein J7M40_16780 [Planctomycetes bacterium]|nr:hypothetical protein [Planctomycetota bacterium]
MSTLTKVLIVLLSLFSIFLCGTVVTYVGNANNYKELYDEAQGDMTVLAAEMASAQRQCDEQVKSVAGLKKDFNERIQLLEDAKGKLMADLRSAERASLQLQSRADSWQGILTGSEQTIGTLVVSLEAVRNELDKVRADDVKESKEFNELTDRLYETMVQLLALQADKRRLLEENSGLEDQLNLAAGGRTAVARANVVTPVEGSARSAVSMPETTDLKGLVSEVGESLVSVSIGSADGVKKDMVFHVTRGDEFICNVVITHVDTNMAAGVLDLKVDQPKIGDTVSTKL